MWILYFFEFIGLICWRIQWRKEILNEFLHVCLLRKCNKRNENIDYFNFLGILHVLSRRTWRTCYFVLPKIIKRIKKEKNLITLFNWFMFVIVFFSVCDLVLMFKFEFVFFVFGSGLVLYVLVLMFKSVIVFLFKMNYILIDVFYYFNFVFSFLISLKLINNLFLYLEADMAFFLMLIKIF